MISATSHVAFYVIDARILYSFLYFTDMIQNLRFKSVNLTVRQSFSHAIDDRKVRIPYVDFQILAEMTYHYWMAVGQKDTINWKLRVPFPVFFSVVLSRKDDIFFGRK